MSTQHKCADDTGLSIKEAAGLLSGYSFMAYYPPAPATPDQKHIAAKIIENVSRAAGHDIRWAFQMQALMLEFTSDEQRPTEMLEDMSARIGGMPGLMKIITDTIERDRAGDLQ